MDQAELQQHIQDASLRLGADVQGLELIRHRPGQYAVFSGLFQHNRAVFRVAVSPRQRKLLAENWAELSRIAPLMQVGRFQVAQPLAYWPEDHVLVQTQAQGQLVLDILKEPSGHVPDSDLAGWLSAYCAPTQQPRAAAPQFWVKRAEALSAQQPHANLAELETILLDHMRELSGQIRGQDWRVAISHGDYHPNNLLWDGQALTGIDIGGSAMLPIYKDMVRCLVHLARRNIGQGVAEFGVDQALTRAFCDVFELTPQERQVMLPFFLCFECLAKVETRQTPKWRIDAAQTLYEGLIKGLKSLY